MGLVSLNLAANGEQPKSRDGRKRAPATPMSKMATQAPQQSAMLADAAPPAPQQQAMMQQQYMQQQAMMQQQQMMYQQQMYAQQMAYMQQQQQRK